jgi:hypothetical protein
MKKISIEMRFRENRYRRLLNRKNSEDEKEGTDVFRNVRDHGSTIFF